MAKDAQDIGQSSCSLKRPEGVALGAGFGIDDCGSTGAPASGARLT